MFLCFQRIRAIFPSSAIVVDESCFDKLSTDSTRRYTAFEEKRPIMTTRLPPEVNRIIFVKYVKST